MRSLLATGTNRSSRKSYGALTRTSLSIVTWRRSIEDPVREWGQLLAYLPEIRRMLAEHGPSVVFLPLRGWTSRASGKPPRNLANLRPTSGYRTRRSVTRRE